VKFVDWIVVGPYFLLMLVAGLYFMRRAGRSLAGYFIVRRAQRGVFCSSAAEVQVNVEGALP